MKADAVPLIMGALILVSSLISLRLGLSVAIIEILLGACAGNLGLKTEEWMIYLANLGGIILTFLAGAEIDTKLIKQKLKESLLIGLFSFLIPFLAVFGFSYLAAGWELQASLIAGVALSTTSLAVVYSVLVETGLNRTEIGKLLMASTFVTDMGTALALSLLFSKPTLYTLVFILASIAIIALAKNFSHLVFDHPLLKNKVIEPELKYIFLLLLAFVYFAKLGEGHAVLPAFLLGMYMARYFKDRSETKMVKNRLRAVSYAFITPVFFILGA